MQDVDDLIARAREAIEASDDLASLDNVRVSFLGKKGELTALAQVAREFAGRVASCGWPVDQQG